MPRILDGAAIAAAIKQEVAEEVRALAASGIKPGLAAVLVGHVPASEIYVRSKVQACAELGLYSDLITPPDTVTTEEMLSLVAQLNARDDIDGILIQLPLPPQVDSKGPPRCHRPRERCRRLSSRKRGPSACWPSGARALHARRRHRDSQAQQHSHRRPARRRRRPQRHCRQARRHAPAPPECDRDDLPLQDTRPAGNHEAGRHSRRRHRPPRLHHAGDGHPGATLIDVGINRLTTREEFDRFFKGDAKREAALSPSAAPSSSATSIPGPSNSPAPTRPCPAAWACSPSRC
jgi:methylenetetrahydrofolate dehydrogenase (NADP+) / methenyltetrahydrofolate cyclohydrolase